MPGTRGRRERTVADLAAQKGLGNAVLEVRTKLGWTPAELAARAGLSVPTINAIERGIQDTTWANLRRLAAGLEVGLDDLIDRATDLAPGPGGDELRRDRSLASQPD